MEDHQKKPTYNTRQDDLDSEVTIVFVSTCEEFTFPIKGSMEDAGVIKLYEQPPTPFFCVAPARNLVGRVPLIPLFLDGNSTPTIPHKFSKRKDSGFPLPVPTLLLWTDCAECL